VTIQWCQSKSESADDGCGACAPVNPWPELYPSLAVGPCSSGSYGTPSNNQLPPFDADHAKDNDFPKQFPRAHRPRFDSVDGEQLDGSVNASGLAADDAGFGAGGCTTFVDP
jgi:hypothetical protein